MARLKTRDVVKLLGVSVDQLYNAMRRDKFPRPEKDSSGDLVWTEEDVQRAGAVLRRDRRQPAA